MIADQLNEIEETRRLAEEAELERRVKLARMKILEMRNVMRPQLQDEVAIKEVVMEDWGHMTEGNQMDLITSSFQEQNKIKKFFETNYAAISDMYKHASAVGSDVGTDTMSFMELSSFLKESNAISGVAHNDMITQIFMNSHQTGKGKITMSSELRRPEFFLSMVSVAVYLNITLTSKKGEASAKARGRKSKTTLSPSEALQKLYDEAFFPYIEKHLDGTSIKAALGTDEVLLLFKEKDEDLSTVFTLYGDRFADKGMEVNSGNTMNLQEFGNCIKDSGLLSRTSTKSNDELTLKEVRQAFSSCQHDSGLTEDEKADDKGNSQNHQTQMTYCEFLEAVARIGAAKWEEGALMDKIGRAIDKVALLLATQGGGGGGGGGGRK